MSDSIWKKEIRFRKRPEPLPPLPAHLLERSRTGQEHVRPERPRGTVVVPVVPVEPLEPLQRVERWTARVPEPHAKFPRTAAGETQDPVALLPSQRAAVDPVPVAPALPQPVTAYGWAKPKPVVDSPVQADPVPVAEEVSDTVAVSPIPAAEEVSHTAVEAPAAPAEKVPLLKREIHLGRKPKAPKEPKAKKEPKPAKEAKPAKEPKAKKEPKVKPAPAEKVPLLKRELHLGRKPKVAAAPAAERVSGTLVSDTVVEAPAALAEQVVKPAPAEKVPLLKRELSLGRKPKQAKTPKAEAGHEKATRVVGLRIGSSQIAAAHVRNNGSAEVVQLARVPLDRGLVVGGEVREPDALAKALKAFFSANKLPRKDIRLGISSNRIGVRVLDVPAVADAKQFENAIRFRAQEVLPIPVTDAVLDHVVLDEYANGEGEAMRRVLLVFAHRELVSRYVDVCRSAGLRLRGIDLDAFALLRAVGPEQSGDGRGASVVVGVGNERTVFAVSNGEVCDFTRVLEWGAGSIDVAIARALGLTPSEAEPIKRLLDLEGTEAPEGLSPMQFEAARAAAKAEIGHLVRELLSSLRFYQSRPESLDIAEIVLSGGGANLAGFEQEVQRGLGATVRVADPFARVTLGKKLTEPAEPGSLAIAVGLGMGA